MTEYRNYFVDIDGALVDVLEDGVKSCACYVSNIILDVKDYKLIKEGHCTVDSTICDMKRSGWLTIDKCRPGAIIVWEEMLHATGNTCGHIGFYFSNKQAISHRDDTRTPRPHHYTYGTKNGKPVRKIEAIYWHPLLDKMKKITQP